MPPRKLPGKPPPELPDTDDFLLRVPQGMIEPLVATMTYMVAYYDGLALQAEGTGHPGEAENAKGWRQEAYSVRYLLEQLKESTNGG